MMEMIERVVAAILRKEVELRDANNALLAAAGLWPDHLYRAPVTEIARAAIEAMREPTDAMVRAGRPDTEIGTETEEIYGDTLRKVWDGERAALAAQYHAMIDATLTKGET